MSHGKFCADPAHQRAYECSRCNDVQCFDCDLPSRLEEVKSIGARYCPDWRCQREQRVEQMNVGKAATTIGEEARAFVRDHFTPGDVSSLNDLAELVRKRAAEAIGLCVYTPMTLEKMTDA